VDFFLVRKPQINDRGVKMEDGKRLSESLSVKIDLMYVYASQR
jgi:hypothetical protein